MIGLAGPFCFVNPFISYYFLEEGKDIWKFLIVSDFNLVTMLV